MRLYTKSQVDEARNAVALMKALGLQSWKDLITVVRANLIQDNPITEQHISRAKDTWQDLVFTIKGKSVRKPPPKHIENYVQVPKSVIRRHHLVHPYLDIVSVSGINFLTSISDNIRYRTAESIDQKTAEVLERHIHALIRRYANAGYTVNMITTDPEFKASLIQVEASLANKIQFSYVAAQGHVAPAERNHRTIKARVRSAYHSLPFAALPRAMLKILVVHETTKLNYFVSRTGLQCSPRTMMKERKLQYGEHCRIPFGAYVQAPHENKHYNTEAPRSLDALYLRPLYNGQNGHELYHIPTDRVITRTGHLQVVPTPRSVILAINKHAE